MAAMAILRKAMWVGRARTLVLWFLALLVAASIGVLLGAKPGHANTFTVINTDNGGPGSLRRAIQNANATPGRDVIRFNIVSAARVKTISPTSALPTIIHPVTINGYSQPGASKNTLAQGNNAVLKVQLNGANAGEGADGLQIEASNSTISGLVINRFDGSEVEISGSGATGNKVDGNFIGTNANGTADLGNAFVGVHIIRASSNTIGGTASGARNVISGNFNGIFIMLSGATGNKVLGNYIGTDKHGSGDLGNGTGVKLNGAENTTIGGTASGARNVISGNDSTGVSLSDSDTTGNKVLGNYIGTTADGTAALGNDFGVSLSFDAEDNTVGGTDSGARNVISGNDSTGVTISSGFGTTGGTTGNKVLGNFIGTTANGRGELGNGRHGVFIFDALNNAIGGTASGAGNRIAHNANDGVGIDDAGATGNRILSNEIFSNGDSEDDLGIDLGTTGVTNNDRDNSTTPEPDADDDTGANNLQNFPDQLSVSKDPTGRRTITGEIESTPSTNFLIQVFLVEEPSGDTSGHGEGLRLLGTTEATFDPDNNDGELTFSISNSNIEDLESEQQVTATATRLDSSGSPKDTSEFAQNVLVPN